MKNKRSIILFSIQSLMLVVSIVCLLTTLSNKMEFDKTKEENSSKVEKQFESYDETPVLVTAKKDNSFIVPALSENMTVTEDVRKITLSNPQTNTCLFKYEIHFNDYDFFIGTDFIAPSGFKDLYLYDVLKQGEYDVTIVLYTYDDEKSVANENHVSFNLLLNVIKE